MNASQTLTDWNLLASGADDGLRLFDLAMLIARDEYPQLDVAGYRDQLDGYVRRLRPSVDRDIDLPSRLTAINRFLYEEIGFAGNDRQYDDPRNSYLNDVFDRKLGIPISLAVIQIEVMRELGLPLEGISFPGHFLVRLQVEDGILVMDPFNQGRPVSVEELRERATPHLGGQAPDDQQLLQILEPATHRSILMRMLRNLKGLYQQRGDFERVARSADRLLKLAPDLVEALRDRGLAYHQLGHASGAREDLGRYLHLAPEADDVEMVRASLIEASSAGFRLN